MHHWGKAPPIDEFTAEDRHITFDDWLPILERAATYMEWMVRRGVINAAYWTPKRLSLTRMEIARWE